MYFKVFLWYFKSPSAQKEIFTRLAGLIFNQCAPNGSNRALMTGRKDKIFCWLTGVQSSVTFTNDILSVFLFLPSFGSFNLQLTVHI